MLPDYGIIINILDIIYYLPYGTHAAVYLYII